ESGRFLGSAAAFARHDLDLVDDRSVSTAPVEDWCASWVHLADSDLTTPWHLAARCQAGVARSGTHPCSNSNDPSALAASEREKPHAAVVRLVRCLPSKPAPPRTPHVSHETAGPPAVLPPGARFRARAVPGNESSTAPCPTGEPCGLR